MNEDPSAGIRTPKRAKRRSPKESELLAKLGLCSKHGDLRGGLELYDRVRNEGLIQLKQHHYNALLYLCSGAATGKAKEHGNSTAGIATPEELNEALGIRGRDSAVNGDIANSGTKGVVDGGMANLREGDASDGGMDSFRIYDMEVAARRGMEIYKDMIQAQVPLNESTFTSVARLAMAEGDGDLAFQIVKRMAAANITPRLRTYGAPLLCFCKNNQAEKAFEVDDQILAAGLLPDESLLEALLSTSIKNGLEYKVYSLLHRLRKTVRGLLPTTLKTIESWFMSDNATSAGRNNLPSKEAIDKEIKAGGGGWHGLGWLGTGEWKVTWTHINNMGSCMSCGEQLCTIDLSAEDTAKLSESLATLAFEREHMGNEFKAFQEWLKKHGPFEVIIDGANVGLYKMQGQPNLNFAQLNKVVKALRERSPTNRPPLIILHCRRIASSLSPKDKLMIEDWEKECALYTTPSGSNDDWYWLYAAVSCKCLLVTNDEMRDHIFQLLGNDVFPKWKERHQVHFDVTPGNLELVMPPPYSTAIQESYKGSWHVPQAKKDGDFDSCREWLCVTRGAMQGKESVL